MAQYVLIQFDSNEEAAGFVKTLEWDTVGSVQVVGIFQKPTLFCECPTPSEKSKRGAKWGWWLCMNQGCGKPKRGQFQQPRNQTEPEGTRTEHRRIFVNIKEPLNG